MGYEIQLDECKIHIKEEFLESIVKDIHSWASKPNEARWVDTKEILDTDVLSDILLEFGWEATQDILGNIYDLEFIREKFDSEDILFEILLKYARKGSYVTIYGGDGDKWRYQYVDDKFEEIRPKF